MGRLTPIICSCCCVVRCRGTANLSALNFTGLSACHSISHGPLDDDVWIYWTSHELYSVKLDLHQDLISGSGFAFSSDLLWIATNCWLEHRLSSLIKKKKSPTFFGFSYLLSGSIFFIDLFILLKYFFETEFWNEINLFGEGLW